MKKKENEMIDNRAAFRSIDQFKSCLNSVSNDSQAKSAPLILFFSVKVNMQS